jgi:hypothetical protein
MVWRKICVSVLNGGVAVAMDDYCPKCGDVRCPICGSKLVLLDYKGNDPDILAKMKSPDFRGFFGCNRAKLHDKVVNGVYYRGKAYVEAVFDDNLRRRKVGQK